MNKLDWNEIGSVRLPLGGKWGNGEYAIVDGDYDGEYLSGFRWYLNPKTGYIYRGTYQWEQERGLKKIIYLHQMVLRVPQGMTVDHINRDKLGNRSVNLRAVSHQLNTANRRRVQDTAKYRGVRLVSRRYQVVVNKKFLGSCETAMEAAILRDKAAYAIYGAAGIYNFPEVFGLSDNNRHEQHIPT
ncbi:hypothetical protein G3I13_01860 [Streptomyces sp. SID6673]|nr:hypothetical protein [Streptomyces sp. SID11726]NDZ94906.1 hypothetical protein [Streptomyces sp. SID11726]NEB23066.1 hypothetical protein [Streptomyces sp. SID6673]